MAVVVASPQRRRKLRSHNLMFGTVSEVLLFRVWNFFVPLMPALVQISCVLLYVRTPQGKSKKKILLILSTCVTISDKSLPIVAKKFFCNIYGDKTRNSSLQGHVCAPLFPKDTYLRTHLAACPQPLHPTPFLLLSSTGQDLLFLPQGRRRRRRRNESSI